MAAGGVRANGAELSDFTASCATWCKQKLSDDDDDHDEHDHGIHPK